ncbi:cell adhesion molecule CEACAM6 [Salvelinus sp. IW2-2015]|uniref:cell adhesion molecule CEACAM6 n=1 Tax=Salvelinus sp. IW2-2015 TaxID=2691554 RepID=UPI000CDF5F8A|nr:carcinoembryonic antigen-related cell adhesion molecule 6 [Salvelinus alpinus]
METAVAISLTLFILTGLCAGQGLFPQGPVNGAEGGTAMFIPNLSPPVKPFIRISWSVGGVSIIAYKSNDSIGPGYGGRITLNKTTGCLELRNLTLADRGEYRVSITTAKTETINGSTELVVYENISDANITGPPNHLFADWSSANLTCEAAGNITVIQWMKEGQPLSGGNIFFSEENRTLFISPVKRHDSGGYVCKLTNPASSATASYRMIVNYGPESMTILGQNMAEVDTHTLIYCSVQSVPPATFTWWFNGQRTGVHEAGYIIRSVSYNNSGDYRCDARNDLTENVVSMGHSLSVKDKTPPPLSPAGAAGIAVAVMLVVVAVALGLYFGITHHRNNSTNTTETGSSHAPDTSHGPGSSHAPGTSQGPGTSLAPDTSHGPGTKGGRVYENVGPPLPPPRSSNIYNRSIK